MRPPNDPHSPTLTDKVVLITGGAHRIGAATARLLHRQGANLVIHYRNSRTAALALQQSLQAERADSVMLIQADLLHIERFGALVREARDAWGRLDVLINNASTFYPTPIGQIEARHWDDLIGSNLKAPLFLSQAAAPALAAQRGCIVNIVDIHADRPLREHPVYSVAKAGLVMLTKALAGELGPEIRVNAIAPGAILWPENGMDEVTKQRIVSRTFLKRQGSANDIAAAALFLIRDAGYCSGHILTVDGGRSLHA